MFQILVFKPKYYYYYYITLVAAHYYNRTNKSPDYCLVKAKTTNCSTEIFCPTDRLFRKTNNIDDTLLDA